MFKSATVLATLALIVSPVLAADYRVLVNKPDCQTVDQFKFNYETLCPVFDVGSPNTYKGVLFEAGDFSGANNATQARVYCTWTNATDGSTYTLSDDVAISLGGSKA
ncbi:hypothetical protein L202_07231 [Cryptococcus amylolentus CBS 6039]|uniref:AA1-like domain-containing protein n=2 Tax=Cryptococcus amylolentus TaxID=104669 RepID=A0A1E3HC31_9TREE|nr:hypothetical protein L202_07231 [Cryptococcus amylolentus CBS 6039]ODN73685.1 hypothetical protein L202_07231 [Cryptococcus amylolentus CBS 6039]ODO00422.1 hypothetical protein I350_07062 [Cryptococcus amylolentus CBS 6273]